MSTKHNLVKILSTSEEDLFIGGKFLNENCPIVFPTDTVYGIGAKLSSILGIEKIYQLKKRPRKKLFPILVPSIKHIFDIIDNTYFEENFLENLISKFWPGPLTMVLKKNRNFHNIFFSDSDYVAIRNPNHFVPINLMKYVGEPLVCTSANISGNIPLNNVNSIIKAFSLDLKVVIDGGNLICQEPSTVIKLSPGLKIEFLREGKLKKEAIISFITNDGRVQLL